MWRLPLAFFCAGLLLAQSSVDQAWMLASQGHRSEAITLLKKFVEQQPKNADAHLLLGSLLMEADQHVASIQHLKTASELRPRSFEAANALGEAYRKFDDASDARTQFEKALTLKPDYGIAHLNLAQTDLALHNNAAALTHLDAAIRTLGHSDEAADALYLRAKFYSDANDPEHASGLLKQAVAIRMRFSEAWSDLGEARKAMLDDAGALQAFEQAVNLNPNDAVAQRRLGSEYLAQDKPEQAIGPLERSRQLNQSDQSTLNALQKALRQSGRSPEAAEVKQQLTDLLRNNDVENQNHLAAIKLNNDGAELEKSGDLDKAVTLYEQAATLYPDHSGIRLNYGVALLRLGRWTNGLNQLHDALAKDPQNSRIRVALDDALSQAPPAMIPKWNDDRAGH